MSAKEPYTFSQRALHIRKIALLIRKTALHIRTGALHIRIRVLHIRKRGSLSNAALVLITCQEKIIDV